MQSERSEEKDLKAPQAEDIDQLSNALFTHLNQQISQLKKRISLLRKSNQGSPNSKYCHYALQTKTK
jgi:hypothetical protein